MKFLKDLREADSTENSWYFSFDIVVIFRTWHYYHHQEYLFCPFNSTGD